VSGIIISAKALLSQNPDPSEAEIRAALDDNWHSPKSVDK
jgi:aerobic-type carbon monoxide dehydrogenase small subunit (CoxS/CutS family)